MPICYVLLRRVQFGLIRFLFDAPKAHHRSGALPLNASLLVEAKENDHENADAENENEEEANGNDDTGRWNGDQLATLH